VCSEILKDVGRRLETVHKWINVSTDDEEYVVRKQTPNTTIATTTAGTASSVNSGDSSSKEGGAAASRRGRRSTTSSVSYGEVNDNESDEDENNNNNSSSSESNNNNTVDDDDDEEEEEEEEDDDNNNLDDSKDVYLSMSNEKYKQVLFRHFKIMSQRDRTKVKGKNAMAQDILDMFEKRLKNSGGGFYKLDQIRNEYFEVEGEEVLRSEYLHVSNSLRCLPSVVPHNDF
jgi:hypothetical protein